MLHNVDLILTLAGGLSAALVLGFITQKLRMSPIVGYLLAGIIVGPYSPGFVADADTASQCAEIGIILLMFGVGLHFHLKDLLAVQRIVLPGAAAQIGAATLLGMVVSHGFGWSWAAGAVFGMAISVASTVVLTRVLSDNKALHTTTGHVALGWLVVEDLFTLLLLVRLPAIVGGNEQSESVWHVLAVTTLKLGALVVFALVVGQRIIPKLLAYVARTGTRDLFTLSVLVLALGVAVGAANFFGASMALGAFLSGMVGGQSLDVWLTDKPMNEAQLEFIFNLKTGALIEAAFMAGAILAGADDRTVEKMEKAGNLIGVAFQIQDDILDVTSTQEVLGKPVLSDEKNHKTTYVTLYGMEKAEKDVIEMSNEALRLIEETGENEFLDELVRRLIHREK